MSISAHHLVTAPVAPAAGSALEDGLTGADAVDAEPDAEVVLLGVGSDPPVHDVRATATATVVAIPHKVGRVRTAMALSWSGSYN